MSDVFISYSRRDTTLVQKIFDTLTVRKRSAWIDKRDINYTTKWWIEICSGIDHADNFVLFISMNSLRSQYCHQEIEYAFKHNKRVIPLALGTITETELFEFWKNDPDMAAYESLGRENMARLRTIQWIDFEKLADVDRTVDALLITVDIDPERVKLHTRLLIRLLEWENKGHDPSILMRGQELAQYETWLTESLQKNTVPHPTDAQKTYIAESRSAEKKTLERQIKQERITRGLILAAMGLTIVLILVFAATISAMSSAANANDQAMTATFAQGQAIFAQHTSVAKEGQANTQVAQSGVTLQAGNTRIADGNTQIAVGVTQAAIDGVTLQAGNTRIADGNTQVAVAGQTLTLVPRTMTPAWITLQAGNTLIADGRTQVAVAGQTLTPVPQTMTPAQVTFQAANTLIAAGNTQVAIIAATLTPIPPRLTAVAQTIVAGNHEIESLSLASAANMILQSTEGNAETAALLTIRTLKSIHLQQADTALIDALSRVQPRPTILNANDAVLKVAFAPDGSTVLIGTRDHMMLWDVKSGKQVMSSSLGNMGMGGVQTTSYSPDGKMALLGDHAVTDIWDISTQQLVHQFQPGGPAVYSPDGKTIALVLVNLAGTGKNYLVVEDASTFKELSRVPVLAPPQFDPNFGLWYLPDGKSIIALDRLWDVASGRMLKDYTVRATVIGLAPDGRTALTQSGTTVDLIDVQGTGFIRHFSGHGGYVNGGTFSPDGKRILTASDDKTLRLWDVATGKLLQTFSGHTDGGVTSVAFSPDGNSFLSGSFDNTARIWPLNNTNALQPFAANVGPLRGLAISPDAKWVLTGQDGAGATLWDRISGQPVKSFPDAGAWRLVFSPDSKTFAGDNTSDKGDHGSVWDIATGKLLTTMTPPGSHETISGISYGSDGKTVLTAFYKGDTILWDIASGVILRTFPQAKDQMMSAAYAPDGQTVLIGSTNVGMWDVNTAQPLTTFDGGANGNDGGPHSLAYSLDGTHLLAGMSGGSVQLWDIKTKTYLNLVGHNGWVNTVAYSPNGRTVLTGGADKTVRLWDAQTGAMLRVFTDLSAPVMQVAYSADGKWVLGGDENGNVRIWLTDYHDLIDYACTRLSRDFTADERSTYQISDQEPTCPQFGVQSVPMPSTSIPAPTYVVPALPVLTPMVTVTPGKAG